MAGITEKIVAGLGVLAIIFCIVWCATPSVLKINLLGQEAKLGVFRVKNDGSETSNDCDLFEGTDCGKALNAKCKAVKGFSVIGLSCAVVVIALQFVSFGGKILKTALALFTAVSFIIVWAVYAQLKNNDLSLDSDCGLKTPDEEPEYMYGFGLQVTASLLCLVMIPLQLMSGRGEGTA